MVTAMYWKNKVVMLITLLLLLFHNNLRGQENKGVIIKGGLGNNISSALFFRDGNNFNRPSSGFMQMEVGYITYNKGIPKFYFALNLQQINYYPNDKEKLNLGLIGLKLGRWNQAKLDNSSVYISLVKGVSFNSFIQTTSSNSGDSIIYAGGPGKNLNLGGFISLPILFSNNKFDVGISPEIAMIGFQFIGRQSSPYYIQNNYHFQSSIEFILKFKFH